MTEIVAGNTGAVNLCAKWNPIQYSITYNLGGDGTNSPEGIDLTGFSSYRTGDAFALPDASVMKWEGHTFAGWYESGDFSGNELREIPAGHYGDVELYAKWTGEACVVNYHENGGKFESNPQLVYGFDDGFSVGQTIKLPSDILRPGYEFDGWYENEDFSGLAVSDIELVVGAVDLYAKWELVEYAIDYVTNGGSWVDDFHVPASSYTIESEDMLLPDASGIAREGYKFKGWFTDENFAGEAEIAIVEGSTGDKTFYAKWEQEQVTPPGPDEPGPDNPGPGEPDPDEPDMSDVVILSLALGVDAQQIVSWTEVEDGRFYGRMEVLRSKMPTKREDFDLKVPDNVEIVSIAKQVQAYALGHPLGTSVGALSLDDAYDVAAARDAAAAFAAAREGSQSDFWDIVLRHRDNPNLQKTYTLEVVPVEDSPAPVPDPDPDPTPTPMPDPTPTPNPNPGSSPTPTTPYVPTANNDIGSDVGLANTGDNAMDGVLALGLLGVCFGVLSLVFGLIARSRRAE